MKVEQASLKASNDNYVYINGKLSKALKKTMDKLQGQKLGINSALKVNKQVLPQVAEFVIL